MFPKRTLLGAALAATLASSASAGLIVHENFDSYTAGALVGQTAGGTYNSGNLVGNTASQAGWDAGWKQIGSTTSVVVAANPNGVSGDNAVFDNDGGSMQATRQWYNPTTDFADGTVIWASVDIRNTSGTDTLFGLFQQSGQSSNFGVASKSTSANTTMQIGVRLAGTSVYGANGTSVVGTSPTVDISFNQFAKVFLKYTLSTANNGDRLDVYVNPASDPGSNLGDISISSGFVNFHVPSSSQGTGHMLVAGFSSGQAAYDNIRIGTTFADVSAIPEPSTFAALAGLGALGLVASRRRRQA